MRGDCEEKNGTQFPWNRHALEPHFTPRATTLALWTVFGHKRTNLWGFFLEFCAFSCGNWVRENCFAAIFYFCGDTCPFRRSWRHGMGDSRTGTWWATVATRCGRCGFEMTVEGHLKRSWVPFWSWESARRSLSPDKGIIPGKPQICWCRSETRLELSFPVVNWCFYILDTDRDFGTPKMFVL